MIGQRWLFASLAATVLGASGCITCGHHGYHLARHASPDCELPSCQRNEVYVFAISSLNPVSIMALDGLREQLNRRGYAKVATGQTIHAGWMAREMRRISEQEPEAEFVVIGFESAGSTAVSLGDRMVAEGLPIGGVVVIQSDGSTPTSAQGLRVIAIRQAESLPLDAETVVVPNVASYGLATHERTVDTVGQLLNATAAIVPTPLTTETSVWDYPHAPPIREIGDPARHPEWSFLFDNTPTTARRPVVTPPVILPSPVQSPTRLLESAIR